MSTYWSGMLITAPNLGVPVSVLVTGVTGTGDIGNVSLGVRATGVTGTGTLGTVSIGNSASVTVTSVSGLGQTGSVSGALVENPVTVGVSAVMELGAVETTSGTAGSVEVTGISCNLVLGRVASWGEIPDSARTAWIEIS